MTKAYFKNFEKMETFCAQFQELCTVLALMLNKLHLYINVM